MLPSSYMRRAVLSAACRFKSRIGRVHFSTSGRWATASESEGVRKHERRSTLYTVRPVTFWVDKILEKENKRPLVEHEPEHEPNLVMKQMSDSYMEEYLPFRSQPALLEEYVSTQGRIRIGKIFEDLDSLAGAIAYKHVNTESRGPPVTIVTASVDRLEVLLPNTVHDLKLSGHVAYVGSSSMEVIVKIDTIPDYDAATVATNEATGGFVTNPTPNTALFARFTMVARNSISGKPVQVNPLYLRTPEERKLFKFAEESKMRKRLAAEASLTKAPPTPDERLIIHDMYMKYSNLDKEQIAQNNMVWMEDTTLQSVFLMQPQDRNIHNKIFGGYLMRRAYELAHATGSLFVQSQIKLLSLDEIAFKKPVPVGSLLNLSSQVIYAPGEPHKSFQVSVTAKVTDIKKGTTDITNTFYFTLMSEEKAVRKIIPRTYAESMLYLEGKRRRERGVKARESLLNLVTRSS